MTAARILVLNVYISVFPTADLWVQIIQYCETLRGNQTKRQCSLFEFIMNSQNDSNDNDYTEEYTHDKSTPCFEDDQ